MLKIRPAGLMAPWTFNMKFSYSTQFLFRSLMLATGKDGNLELFTQGPAPSHYQPVYKKDPYYPADPSTLLASSNACSGLNPYAGLYYLSVMMS
jgi:hypothetical protein